MRDAKACRASTHGRTKMKNPGSRRLPSLIWAVFVVLVCTLSWPVLSNIWAASTAEATSIEDPQRNPRSNFWRQVRNGISGYSAVGGPDSNVLVNRNGHNWRQFRVRVLAPYGAYLMGGALFVIAMFFAIRGPIAYPADPSVKYIVRFSVYQRIIHWFTALLFWLLAISGLVLLYGRFVLIPLFGSSGFAAFASASKEAHNLFGPIFILALCLLIIEFARDNFFSKGDGSWLRRGGGPFRRHASAGRFNCGEKIWFWLIVILGTLLSISGILLDFSVLGFNRNTLEFAHVIHGIAALIFISAAFGHVYLGTIGTRGTLRGMTTGLVDRGWASLHHDRWAAETSDTENEEKSG